TPTDLIRVNASGGPYTITAAANLALGALLFNNTSTNQNITLLPAVSMTVNGGQVMTLGSGSATDSFGAGGTNPSFIFPVQTNFGAGPITFTGGALQSNNASQTFSNALTLSGAVTFSSQTVVFTGPINLASNAYFILNASIFMNGVVSGPGTLVIAQGGSTAV